MRLAPVMAGQPLPGTRLLQAGAAGYLTKGAGLPEMVQAIRLVFAGQRYISPQIAQPVNLAPIVVALIAGLAPLLVAWKVEGGNGARVSGALGTDFILVLLAFVGIGVLTWRFDKREREAL